MYLIIFTCLFLIQESHNCLTILLGSILLMLLILLNSVVMKAGRLLKLCSNFLSSLSFFECNVIVTRPTNHMISTRDHSHDLLTWSRHVTYELHPDIKSSSIPSSASSSPCHDYLRVPHSSYDYYISSSSRHASSIV